MTRRMAVPVGAAPLHPPRPTRRRPRGEGIDRCRRSPTAKLPTARRSTLRGTTIPPLWRRIGPRYWDHPDTAAAWEGDQVEYVATGQRQSQRSRGKKKACEEGTVMGEERRFPCPYCGFEFHYTPDEPRLSATCLNCGRKLTMPHGNFDMRHVTPGPGAPADLLTRKPVFGLRSGGMTGEQLEYLTRRNATWAIRRWEE